MAKILLYVVLAVISCCGTVADDIECFPNQTIHYTHTDSAIYTHYTAFYEADNGTILSCVDYEDSNNDDVYFDCHSSTAMLTVHIYYENRTTVYTFQCSSETTVSETLITVSANQTHKSIDLVYNITSTFLDGYGNFVPSAEIGETVYFVITAPKEYPLLPLECNATGGAGQYKTIIALGCTEDDDLISSFSINLGAHETTYSAAICVFQFHGSDSLTLTCNVRVCNQAGDCDFNLNDTCLKNLQAAVKHTSEIPKNNLFVVKPYNAGPDFKLRKTELYGPKAALSPVTITETTSHQLLAIDWRYLVGHVKYWTKQKANHVHHQAKDACCPCLR